MESGAWKPRPLQAAAERHASLLIYFPQRRQVVIFLLLPPSLPEHGAAGLYEGSTATFHTVGKCEAPLYCWAVDDDHLEQCGP